MALSSLHEPIPLVQGYYYFSSWNTSPDGSGEVFDAATRITENIVVYAMWDFVVSFTFTKVDGNDMCTLLKGAIFTMYSGSHIHDEECGGLEDPVSCTHLHDELVAEGSYWVQATGFSNPVTSKEVGTVVSDSFITRCKCFQNHSDGRIFIARVCPERQFHIPASK